MANWAALQEKLIDKPVFKRARHGIHFKQADGSILANFSGKPCHYQDKDGLWKPIDTKLIAIGTEYGAPGLMPRIKTDGTVRIDGTDYNQRSTRIGIFDPTTRAFTAIKTIPLGTLDDDKLVAESGIWKRELRLTEDGLREEIVIASKPTNTGADLNDWLVLETQVTGVSFPDGWLSDFKVSEFNFPAPSAHDAEGNEADCKRYARTVNGKQYIYTGVPATWLVDAVYPVVIDPDFGGTTTTGYAMGQDADYATARATSNSGGINTSYTELYSGQLLKSGTYKVARAFLGFDTSSIDDGTTITQVNLKITNKWANSQADVIIIKKYDWTGTRETDYDAMLTADEDDGYYVDISVGLANNTQYTSQNLNTTWVSKTGTTKYGLMSDKDQDNTAPSVEAQLILYATNHATEAYRPVLTVTYSAAGNPWNYYAQM